MSGCKLRTSITVAAGAYLSATLAGAAALSEHALRPPRIPVDHGWPETVRQKLGVTVEDVAIGADDGVRLTGWYVQPGRATHSAVLVLHGVGENRMQGERYAEFLLRSGYAVLLPDSRAHGESGGRFVTYGVDEKHDVRRWIDWLADRCISRVFLLGESMGAAIAIQATAVDSRIRATVAECPFASFREAAYERVGQMFHLGRRFGRSVGLPLVELGMLIAHARAGVNLFRADPIRAMRRARTPVLLIHGQADEDIAPLNSERLLTAGGAHVELWRVLGAAHTKAFDVWPEEFSKRVLNWFADH